MCARPASGETHPLPVQVLQEFIDFRGSRMEAKSSLPASLPRTPIPSVWSISLLGRNLRKLREDVEEAVPSPDGSKILFTTKLESEIWVMGSNGEEPAKILSGAAQDAFGYLAWFPDGKRILFLRYPVVGPNAVESLELDGGQPAIVVSAHNLNASVFLRDGRLLYGIGVSPANDSAINLWQVRVDLKSGRAAGGTHTVHAMEKCQAFPI